MPYFLIHFKQNAYLVLFKFAKIQNEFTNDLRVAKIDL